jgi:hypothetical protein
VIDELPFDFETESYYLSLWENGKQFDKGDKIDSSELSSYTFDNLETTQTNLELTVKISSDGETEYDLFDLSIDNKTGRVKIVKSYTDYPKYEDIDDSEIPEE